MTATTPTSSVAPTSSAVGLVLTTEHTCARHPAFQGERQCLSCSNALCSACARSQQHHHCGECRTRNGQAAHVVDVGWRVSLVIDSVLASWRAIPRRAPAVLAILLVSLLAPLSLLVADSDTSEVDDVFGGWGDAALVGALFALAVFSLGWFFQPLIAFPLASSQRKAGLGRSVVAGVVGTLTAFVPVALVVGACVALDEVINDAEIVGNLAGLAFLAVAPVSLTLGLTWQAQLLLGQRPGLRGVFGAIVAHCCVVGVWSTIVWVLLIPIGATGLVGFFIDPAVAGVIGVVGGLVVWLFLLLGSGSFAAASARYSDDLDRLS